MITQAALADFRAIAGPQGLVEDQDLIAPWLSDWRDKYHGRSVSLELVQHALASPEMVLGGTKLDDPASYRARSLGSYVGGRP